jgi:hypothetical protein
MNRSLSTYVLDPLISPHTSTNTRLQQIINQNKDERMISLQDKNLTCKDMEMVAYHLIQNNKVNQYFIYFCSQKIKD